MCIAHTHCATYQSENSPKTNRKCIKGNRFRSPTMTAWNLNRTQYYSR